MKQAIKGQDTVVQVVSGGAVIDSLTSVTNFDIKFDMNIISKGYIGETTERKDDIFNGVSGSITLDWTDTKVVDFIDKLIKRSRRTLPYFAVNILSTIRDPKNNLKRIIVQDVHFSDPDANMGGRAEYMTTTLTFQASEYTIL